MNQEDFLQQLAGKLAPLSDVERTQVLDYYREIICDGKESGRDEQELIAGFGAPQTIAAQLLSESRSTVPQHTTAGNSAGNSANMPPVQADSGAYAPKGPVHSIIVDARYIGVTVRQVAHGPVQIHFTPTASDRVTVAEKDGIFTFCHTKECDILHWRDLFAGPQNILVDLPEEFSGDLSVTTCTAQLTISGPQGLNTVSLTTSNGRLTADSLTCNSLYLKSSNGALDLYGLSGSHLVAESSNGRICAEDCSFSDELHLYTSNGAIRAQNLAADNLEFSTSNGPISATILGDMREYAVRSHTSNASSNLPSEMVYPEQTKSLRVHTNNARIEVQFIPQSR